MMYQVCVSAHTNPPPTFRPRCGRVRACRLLSLIWCIFILQGKVYYKLPGYTDEETTAIYEQLLYLLCSPGHIGSMFQATSTNDVTFWVLHPTVDRCSNCLNACNACLPERVVAGLQLALWPAMKYAGVSIFDVRADCLVWFVCRAVLC